MSKRTSEWLSTYVSILVYFRPQCAHVRIWSATTLKTVCVIGGGGENPEKTLLFQSSISLLSFSRHDEGAQIAILDGGGGGDGGGESGGGGDGGESGGGEEEEESGRGASYSSLLAATRQPSRKYDPATAAALFLWEWRSGILCGRLPIDGPLEATSLTFLPPTTSSLSASFSAQRTMEQNQVILRH